MIRLGDIATKESISCDRRLADVEVNLDAIMDVDKDIAFLSGSVVEGFGNLTSDVDIYIISKDLKMAECKICSNKDRYYVEFNIYAQETIDTICDNVNRIYENPTYMNIRNADLNELEFYYRMAIGIPVINAEKFYRIKEKFDKTKANFIYERYFSIGFYDNIRLIKIFLSKKINCGDRLYFLAQDALHCALDSFLARHGEGYKSSKFRYKKISRVFGETSGIYLRALDLRYLGTRDFQKYVDEVISFCDELNIYNYNTPIIDELRFMLPHNPYIVLKKYLIQKKIFIYEISEETQFVIQEILAGNNTETLLFEKVNNKYGLSINQLYEIIETLEVNDVIRIY